MPDQTAHQIFLEAYFTADGDVPRDAMHPACLLWQTLSQRAILPPIRIVAW
jgi:hypothetical protein